jgi:preprotein translocase subunit SecA
VLNAKFHADEAKIVALAGHKGAVTVATNMAGRGTDIMLGGSVEFLADQELRKRGLEPSGETAEAYEQAWQSTVDSFKERVKAEHEEVKELGGLYVIGTERHESRRIDNQLRGRSGRQGDPGESRFYLSLQDELMRLFKSDWVDRILVMLKIPDDMPIENKRVTNAIASAQAQVESQNFESRKNVLKYDDVMDRQRKVIYGERREVLEGRDIEEQVRGFIDDTVTSVVTGATQDFAEEWDLDQLWTDLRQLWPVSFGPERFIDEVGDKANLDRDEIIAALKDDAQAAYDRREAQVGEEVMRELERQVLLSVLDRKWREHLYEMDYLREGIYLRAYSQRDPLVEYQKEGFEMFATMMDGIKEEAVGFLFNLEVEVEDHGDHQHLSITGLPDDGGEEYDEDDDGDELDDEDLEVSDEVAAEVEAELEAARVRFRAKGLEPLSQPQQLTYTAPSEDGEAAVVQQGVKVDPYAGVGRNDPCPCGSGKKFKACHGAPGKR